MTKLDSHETKTTFAARVGLTKGRISQLVAEGLPVRADGRIDVAVGLAWIEDNLDPARRNKGGAAAAPVRVSTTLAEAKRLHEIVKVQRAKLAFEREQGLLVETAAATRTVFARARAERDAHMAWVQRSAPLLAAEVGAEGYADVPGFCKSASLEEIRSHGHVLTPGRYVGAEAAEEDETPFADRFAALQEQLEAQFAEAEELTATIRARLTGMFDGE